MADVKISQLPAASDLDGSEIIPVVQGGATRRTTVGAVGAGSLTAAPGKVPKADSTGRLDPSWYAALLPNVAINDIGIPGAAGFGVGICPTPPAGFTPLAGCVDVLSANYGNYQYTDGSIMVWVPAFYFRIGHANNPTYGVYGANSIDIKPVSAFPDEATANASGYYLHRAFVNGGAVQPGFFRDKYDCSLNGNIASSLALGMPLVSGPQSQAATTTVAGVTYTILTIGTTDYTLIGAASNTVGLRFTATGAGAGTGTVSRQTGFAQCTANGQTPTNTYGGALSAAKSRGDQFFPESVFIADAISRISEAHAQAATSALHCAWYDPSGARNYPKGNDNNALKSEADVILNGAGAVTFQSAGLTTPSANLALAGSGAPFERTTHNGQSCGISDVAGNVWKINPGLTCIAANKAITGATQTNPVQLTVVGHGLTTGDYAQVDSVGGMTQLNGKIYKVTVVDVDNITLDGVDGTGFTAYTSGGKVINGSFYALKPSVDIAAVTAGNSGATDHWGGAGVAAQFDAVDLAFATTYPSNGLAQRFGSGANAVFDWGTEEGRAQAMLGMPAAGGMSTSGSSLCGQDQYYQYISNELCVRSRGRWDHGGLAGSRCLSLSAYQTASDNYVGLACASYLP